ncbi:MAG: quinate 5-dehydrogenase [Candidatus Calescibacterium sp.]|nr:quinate 5-dehydrogenase [Candidatus Calescibacterium sp.]MDW8132493.1 quinate 5-dehydrogenase [Candidatus Calescibacterium sp.]
MEFNCVSISLGSSRRDKHISLKISESHIVNLYRIGVDGDFLLAQKIIERLQDDDVDAIGLGGIDLLLFIENEYFVIKDAKKLYDKSKNVPIVDGSITKRFWEPQVVDNLIKENILNNDQGVLLVSSLDRFATLEIFKNSGFKILIGDLLFALNVGKIIYDIDQLKFLAKIILKDVLNLPFNLIYPVGREQEKESDFSSKNLSDILKSQDFGIVFGDFHYIRKMKDLLFGKVVITNTLTENDINLLMDNKVRFLITTGIFIENRSFGANMTDAIFAAYCRRVKNKKISPLDFNDRDLFLEFVREFLGVKEIKGNIVYGVK